MMSASACRKWVCALVALGAVTRLVASIGSNVGHDGWVRGNTHYLEMAENLLAGRGYQFEWYFEIGTRWANRPPGYAFYVAALRWLFSGSAIAFVTVGSLIGASTIYATATLARKAAGDLAAVLAAAGVAFHPYYVVNDGSLSENGLYTALMAWTAIVLWDFVVSPAIRPAIALGVAFAVTGLVRVTWFATLPFAFAWALGWTRVRSRLAWISIACIAPMMIVTCAPWLVRNYDLLGKPAMAIDSGRALWNGHNPHTLSAYPEASIDKSEKKAWYALDRDVRDAIVAAENEADADAIFMDLALENIRADKPAALRRSLVKLVAFLSPEFNPGPAGALKRWTHGVVWLLTLPPLLLALVSGLGSRRLSTFALAVLVGALVPSVAFWGQTRFRMPVDWLLLAVTGAVVAGLSERRWSRPIQASRP